MFEQLAWADSGRGVAACSLDLGQSNLARSMSVTQTAAQAQQSAVPTDAAPAFRDWLDSLLEEGEKGAVMVPVLALEGVMAFVYWRGLRPYRQGDRPK